MYTRVHTTQVFLTSTHLAIAMEFAPGGDLFKYVTERNPHGKLREDQARWVFQQLVIGLDYCHRRVWRFFVLVGGCVGVALGGCSVHKLGDAHTWFLMLIVHTCFMSTRVFT